MTRQVSDRLRELFSTDCDVYFAINGTAANCREFAGPGLQRPAVSGLGQRRIRRVAGRSAGRLAYTRLALFGTDGARFMRAWDTSPERGDALLADLRELAL